jgi:hypothetical protein
MGTGPVVLSCRILVSFVDTTQIVQSHMICCSPHFRKHPDHVELLHRGGGGPGLTPPTLVPW